jgi:peptidoglycan/xylan/chitin deacetylase (PgdA/CDA1 family)
MLVDRWRAVAAAGHELGNHSVNHPCMRGSFEMPEQYMNENLSVDVMLADVQVMERMLTAIDGKPKHSYATPCGQNLMGGEDYVAPLIASGIVSYVRDERAPYPEGAPPPMATGFAEVTGAQMIAWVEQVRASGGLGIIVFHGVGGDHLAVSAEAHQELVTYLKAHEREIWTTTFTEALDHVNGR